MKKGILKRSVFSPFIVLLLVFSLSFTATVFADDGDLIVISQNENGDETDDVSAYDENHDGDHVYVTNNGTTIEIPSVDKHQRVYDYYGLLYLEEMKDLRERISAVEEESGINLVILLTGDIPTDRYDSDETTNLYSNQFYMDNGFAEDGFMLTIDMNNRIVNVCSCGKFDNGRGSYNEFNKSVSDKVSSYLKSGDYYKGCKKFISCVKTEVIPPNPLVPTGRSLIFSAIAAAVAALFLTIKHKASQPNIAKLHVETPIAGEDILNRQVIDLGERVTSRVKRSDDSSRGGGFSGGSSGGFSGGGSFSHGSSRF